MIGPVIEQLSTALILRVSILGVYQVISLIGLSIHRLVFVLRALIEFLSHQLTLLSRVMSMNVV